MPVKLSMRFLVNLLVLCQSLLLISEANAAKNGFDLGNSILPVAQIKAGGPPKDGIPALTNPAFIDAKAADYLQPQDRILGISLDGIARAYPIAILNWHEIVNDQIKGRKFAVTYCPLCGTGVVFDASSGGQALEFGVSGLLYNSDVLLYDRDSESLWSQIMGQAISGRFVGTKLNSLPVTHTSWQDWQQQHPNTQVLSTNTGYGRDYSRNPYGGYDQSRQLFFEVSHQAPDEYHPKELVVGVEIDGLFKAYPFIELDRQGLPRFSDVVNGRSLDFSWDSKNRSVTISDDKGDAIAGIQGFWFAWYAFHPQTQVFKSSQ